MFIHLISIAEQREAKLAVKVSKWVDAFAIKHKSLPGRYLVFFMSLAYYIASVIGVTIASSILITLFILLRIVIPIAYVLLCIAFIGSGTTYLFTSNWTWYIEHRQSALLTHLYPLLSDPVIAGIYAIVPVILFASVCISFMMVVSIIYRKNIFQ